MGSNPAGSLAVLLRLFFATFCHSIYQVPERGVPLSTNYVNLKNEFLTGLIVAKQRTEWAQKILPERWLYFNRSHKGLSRKQFSKCQSKKTDQRFNPQYFFRSSFFMVLLTKSKSCFFVLKRSE